MKVSNFVLVMLLLISFGETTSAHEHETVSRSAADSAMQHEMESHRVMESVSAFPNYHPLVIHFPIVLLLVATLFQGLSLFMYRREFSLVTLILLSLGVLSTWLASHTFHAHPGVLTGRAEAVFETHEQMASLTWWFSLAAFAVKIVSYFFLQRKWWIETIVSLLLIGSAVTVSVAGHHGAMLVHMEGIGPMGKYLDSYRFPTPHDPLPSANESSLPSQRPVGEAMPEAQEQDHHVGEFGEGPHGGTIEEADPYHIEILSKGSDLVFYLLDGDAKSVSAEGITGQAILHSGNTVKKIELMQMGGALTAMDANSIRAFSVECTLIKNGKRYTASFDSRKDLDSPITQK